MIIDTNVTPAIARELVIAAREAAAAAYSAVWALRQTPTPPAGLDKVAKLLDSARRPLDDAMDIVAPRGPMPTAAEVAAVFGNGSLVR